MLGYVPELVIEELGADMAAARAAGLALATDGAAAFGKPDNTRTQQPDTLPINSKPPGSADPAQSLS